jgi:hypothetical protein
VRHGCELRPEDLGPYLLGQLPADEEERVADAVARCPACADEVRRLRPAVGALAVAAPHQAADPLPLPAAALDRVLGTVQEQRRVATPARRAMLGAAAVAVAVAFGLLGFVLGLQQQRSGGESVQLAGAANAGARAVLDDRSWGTAIELDAWGLEPDKTYGAWLARADGQRVPAGSFRPDRDGRARLDLGAALARRDSSAVGVTALTGTDVLTAHLPAR